MNNNRTAVLEKMKEISNGLDSLILTMKSSKIEKVNNMAEQLENIKMFSKDNNIVLPTDIMEENKLTTESDLQNKEEEVVLQEEYVKHDYSNLIEVDHFTNENDKEIDKNQDHSEDVSIIENEVVEIFNEKIEDPVIENSELTLIENNDVNKEEIISIKEVEETTVQQDLALPNNAEADPRSLLRREEEITTPIQEEYNIFIEKNSKEESSEEKEKTETINKMAESNEVLHQLEAEDSIVDEIVTDESIIEIMIEDYQEKVPMIQKEIELLSDGNQDNIKSLLRNLHTLKGNFGAFGALRGRNEVHKIENIVLSLSDGKKQINEIHNELIERFENVMNLIEAHTSNDFSYKIKNYDLEIYNKSLIKEEIVKTVDIDHKNEKFVELTKEELEQYNLLLEEDEDIIDEIDHEIMPIFIEDTVELLPKIRTNLELLINEEPNVISELHRDLHTLKGGVGMVGAKRARKEVHKMENIMLEVQNGKLSGKEVSIDLENRFDNIMKLLDAFTAGNYNFKLDNYDLLLLQRKMDHKENESNVYIENIESKKTETTNAGAVVALPQSQKIRIMLKL